MPAVDVPSAKQRIFPDLMTYAQAAKALTVSENTLHRYRRAGCIPPPQRFGGNARYPAQVILDIIEKGLHLPGTFKDVHATNSDRGRAGAVARFGQRKTRQPATKKGKGAR